MFACEPDRLGPYTVQRPLGKGGMAVVYLCERLGIGGFRKQVVAKLIRPEHAGNEDFVLMFLDEARMSATLSHPNLVQVFEVDTLDGAPYIIMEYVRGPSLNQVCQRAHGARAVHYGHLACVLAAVGRGLHHAHFGDGAGGPDVPARIVHRDVSLQNILVATDGTPKLIDFGIARAEGRLHQTGSGWKGKVLYVAPEQVLEEPVDHRCDVYALGVSLYRATTGHMPFSGDTIADTMAKVIAGHPPRPSTLVPGYPEVLESILDRALARVPDRYPTAAAMAADLEAFCASGEWASDVPAVASWLRGLFPNGSEDWLGPEPPVEPTPTPVTDASERTDTGGLGTIDPTPVILRPPQPDPGSLFMVVAIAFLTLIGVGAVGITTIAMLLVDAGFVVVLEPKAPPEPAEQVRRAEPPPGSSMQRSAGPAAEDPRGTRAPSPQAIPAR